MEQRASEKVRGAVFLAAGLLIFAGCSINSSNPAGFEFSGRDPSLISADTLSASGSDTTWTVDLTLDFSDRLFIGEHEGYESVALIGFSLTDLPTDAVIEEATLTLRGRSDSIGDSADVITLRINPVSTDWDSTWTGLDRPGLVLDAPVAENSALFYTITEEIAFTLPPSLIQGWLADPASASRGIAVTYLSPAPFLLYVTSRDVSGSMVARQPRLEIKYVPSGGGSSRTINLRSADDTSLLTFSGTPPGGELWVGRGVPFRTLITFDVSHITGRSATINRAVLKLHLNPGSTLAAPVTIAAALPLYDDPWNAPLDEVVDEDTFGWAVAIDEPDSSVAMVVTSTVAAHMLLDEPQLKMLVLASRENTGIGLVRVLDSSAAPEFRPSLEITYSLPPEKMP